MLGDRATLEAEIIVVITYQTQACTLILSQREHAFPCYLFLFLVHPVLINIISNLNPVNESISAAGAALSDLLVVEVSETDEVWWLENGRL